MHKKTSSKVASWLVSYSVTNKLFLFFFYTVNSVVLWNGEVMDLPIPTQEVVVDQELVTEEERHIHADFFDGRPSKTLERYLRIRNYILDTW